jgi:mono/diheme cytochrome c family protein
LLWNARCATCHGTDGRFNEKFVREFYPVPQKLSVLRIDSLGVDSLVKVVLNGRVNMNPYACRLTSEEALGLVNYMRVLAETLAGNAVPESIKEEQ